MKAKMSQKQKAQAKAKKAEAKRAKKFIKIARHTGKLLSEICKAMGTPEPMALAKLRAATASSKPKKAAKKKAARRPAGGRRQPLRAAPAVAATA